MQKKLHGTYESNSKTPSNKGCRTSVSSVTSIGLKLHQPNPKTFELFSLPAKCSETGA